MQVVSESERRWQERRRQELARQEAAKARRRDLGVEMFGRPEEGGRAEAIKRNIPLEVAHERNVRAAEAAFDEAAREAKEAADALAAHEYSRLKAKAAKTAAAAREASDALNKARRNPPQRMRPTFPTRAGETYDRWRAEHEAVLDG